MILVLIFLCVGIVNCHDTNKTEGKLIFTQVLFRHGDRTIVKSYPNDPYKDKVHWPDGIGQLTKLGKQQEFHNLGKFLRRRYKKFLGAHSPDKISVLSSGFDRTINSANLVLAAMFPPKANQVWNNDLLWQPIAVHSLPRNVDYLIQPEIACARYIAARKRFENTPEIKSLKERNQKLFEYLEEHTGQSIQTLEHIRDIYETLEVEKNSNKTLPRWTIPVFSPGSAFEQLAHYWYAFITGNSELKRLRSGALLKEILDRFKNKTTNSLPDQLMQIYSGHDSTIAGILNSLGVFDVHAPPHSSSILFELYGSSSGQYIQIFYRNSSITEMTPLDIPDCGSRCSLNRFYELYDSILPPDIEVGCRLTI